MIFPTLVVEGEKKKLGVEFGISRASEISGGVLLADFECVVLEVEVVGDFDNKILIGDGGLPSCFLREVDISGKRGWVAGKDSAGRWTKPYRSWMKGVVEMEDSVVHKLHEASAKMLVDSPSKLMVPQVKVLVEIIVRDFSGQEIGRWRETVSSPSGRGGAWD